MFSSGSNPNTPSSEIKSKTEKIPCSVMSKEKDHQGEVSEAQFKQGMSYQYGINVPQDFKEAARLYRLAANQGHAGAQNNLGSAYYIDGRGVPQDDKEAARLWRLAADQGYAEAQYNLGFSYYNGRGVPQDDKEAARLWRLAADQGCAEAQNNLGFSYYNGRGVPQDDKEAARLLRLAADQGLAVAQKNLGFLYYNGCGVPQDDKEAVRLYRLAADQGVANAKHCLGVAFDKIRSAEAIYHAAIVIGKPEMQKSFNDFAKNNPEKFITLLEENSQDSWDKIEPLLKPEVAVKIYEYWQKRNLSSVVKKLSAIEQATPLGFDLSEVVVKYLVDERFIRGVHLKERVILDRKAEAESIPNKIKSFFTPKQENKELASQLGFDCLNSYKEDMKQIGSYFLYPSDPTPPTALRSQQGLQLRFIYDQIKKVQDKLKTLTDAHKISMDSLHTLKSNIAETQKLLASDSADHSNDVIHLWFQKLAMFQSCIDNVIEYKVKNQSVEGKSTDSFLCCRTMV